MQWRLILCFVNAFLLTPTLQCGCILDYTQDIACATKLIVEVTVNSKDSKSDVNSVVYGITVDSVIYGQGEFDSLTNKTIVLTPNENSICESVFLDQGGKYILTATTYDKVMEVNSCDFIDNATTINPVTKRRLAGEYQKNCECLAQFDNMPLGNTRTKIGCSSSDAPDTCSSSLDVLCAKDSTGQCNWEC